MGGKKVPTSRLNVLMGDFSFVPHQVLACLSSKRAHVPLRDGGHPGGNENPGRLETDR